MLELYGLDGSSRGTINLPGVGTSRDQRPQRDRELYFSFTSFLQPPAIYRYDLDARNTVPWRETRPDTSLAHFETTQLFFTSKDGTRVPMFITARRESSSMARIQLSSLARAFNVPATPIFSAEAAAWLGWRHLRRRERARRRVRTRVACRDGNEEADLVRRLYFIRGILNWSALHSFVVARDRWAGAAGCRRRGDHTTPELFGAALVDAGILDMTRFSCFTIGAAWMPEFDRLIVRAIYARCSLIRRPT